MSFEIMCYWVMVDNEIIYYYTSVVTAYGG